MKYYMENLWIFYWLSILVSLILGILSVIKRNKIAGFMQVTLSIILPIWAFFFQLKGNYFSTQSEWEFMHSKIMQGSIEAILLLILYIVLILIFIYNFIRLVIKGKVINR